MRSALPVLLASCLLLSGCYQARMTTGKAPSNTVVEKKWASSYLYGLIAAEIDVSEACTHGIASAERIFTFPNMLVNTLTLGIYLPQNVTVTCAAEDSLMSENMGPGGINYTLTEDATAAEFQEILTTAEVHSSITHKPARVWITPK